MPISINPEWQHLALYAGGGALLLILIFNIPFVGRIIRALLSFGLLAFCLFLLLQQAPFDPTLSRFTARLGLDDQVVAGEEVRIRLSRDGHFWARVSVNGVERRMLVDSGATFTALSEETAREAGIEARNLKVVISPALGPIDVLGMNFLSQLASWRVEGRTLILTPPASGQGGDRR